jgi:hypothetical protein
MTTNRNSRRCRGGQETSWLPLLRNLLGLTGALALLLIVACSLLTAHDLPVNTIINAFVKIEAQQAHLVVRVPLDLLRGAPFPVDAQTQQYDVAGSGPATQTTLRLLAEGFIVLEDGVRLVPSSSTGRLSLPSDRSFEDYDRAIATAARPTDLNRGMGYGLGYFDAHFVYPISSPKSVFKIQSLVAADLGSLTKLTVRYMPLGDTSRAMIIPGGSEPVALNPTWLRAARGFVVLGVGHILSGIDHLLFLLCLILPFRRIRGLIPVITAFTLGHSVTLLGSTFNLAPSGSWFPPFVETAIAASIVYMALENIVGASLRRRWIIAGLFGLVHGFGFSYALKDQLQFAGSHLLVSLFSFNVGIELGQLAVLCVTVPALGLLFRGALAGRTGIILLSAIVAHTAWHWMIDRGNVLWQAPWPRLTGHGLMEFARWLAGLLIAAGLARLLGKWIESRWPTRPVAVIPSETPPVEPRVSVSTTGS